MKTRENEKISLSDDVLTDTNGASKLLGIPASTLAKWRSTGENNVPYIKIGGHVRYSTTELREYTKQKARR